MNTRLSVQAAFCHVCGAESAIGAAFCHECGTKLATIAVTAVRTVEPSTDSSEGPISDPPAESDGGPERQAADAPLSPMTIDDEDLPRNEWLELDTPILAAPRPGSAVIRKGMSGDRVVLTAFEDGYAVLMLGGRKGYVVQEAIVGGAPSSFSTWLRRARLPQIVRLAWETEVRSEPNPGSTVIFCGQRGEPARLVGAESGYARLDFDGVDGFVLENAIDFGAALSASPRIRPQPVRRTYPRQDAVALRESAATPANGGFRAGAPWVALIASLAMTGGALMRWSQNGFGSAANGTHWGQGNAIVVLGLVGVGIALSRGLGGRTIPTSLAQLGVAIGGLWCGIYIARQIGDYCIEKTSGACIGEGGWLAMAAAVALGIVSGIEIAMDLADDG